MTPDASASSFTRNTSGPGILGSARQPNSIFAIIGAADCDRGNEVNNELEVRAASVYQPIDGDGRGPEMSVGSRFHDPRDSSCELLFLLGASLIARQVLSVLVVRICSYTTIEGW